MLKEWFSNLFSVNLLLAAIISNGRGERQKLHPEYDLTFEQRVKFHGYPVKTHKIITEDDYVNVVYHIPHGLKKDTNTNKSVVLIIHGMGGCPHNFIVLGPKLSAPYVFAELGLDVWLFSSRGQPTPYKMKHKTLDWNKDGEFWLHSFHEIGKYDLASTIDFIYNYTGHKKVALIGHSAGGNEIFALLSEKPEYNKKVSTAINWGSSPIIKRMDYPAMRLGVLIGDFVKAVVKYSEMAELLPTVQPIKPVLRDLCREEYWLKFCMLTTDTVGSHVSIMARPQDIQIYISNLPRMSSRQIIHFVDNIRNGSFRKHDYGRKGNMKRYGQEDPPHYNLSATTVPVAFYIGPSDGEITKPDIYESMSKIPNPVLLYEVKHPKFTHTDFVFGRYSNQLVYEPTFNYIRDINKGIIPPKPYIPANLDEYEYMV